MWGLAACSAQPGTALEVDGVRYSEDQVSQASAELTAFFGEAVPQSVIVSFLGIAPSVDEVAQEAEAGVSDSDVRNLMAEEAKAAGVELSSTSIRALRTNVEINALQKKTDPQAVVGVITEKQKQRNMVVNPRYGVVNEDGMLTPPVLNGVLDARKLLPPMPAN